MTRAVYSSRCAFLTHKLPLSLMYTLHYMSDACRHDTQDAHHVEYYNLAAGRQIEEPPSDALLKRIIEKKIKMQKNKTKTNR